MIPNNTLVVVIGACIAIGTAAPSLAETRFKISDPTKNSVVKDEPTAN